MIASGWISHSIRVAMPAGKRHRRAVMVRREDAFSVSSRVQFGDDRQTSTRREGEGGAIRPSGPEAASRRFISAGAQALCRDMSVGHQPGYRSMGGIQPDRRRDLPGVGIEPTRPCGHRILRAPRGSGEVAARPELSERLAISLYLG
jgi:hypothetical protein